MYVAGVRITGVRAKEGLVDDSNVLVGAGASEIGGMVKGKGTTGRSTDGFMQIPRTVSLKCTPPSIHLFHFHLTISIFVPDGAILFYTTP